MTVRVIPRLDIKGPNLVKGVHLEGLRVLGAPEDFARYYYEHGADELLYQDAVASLYERNSLTGFIERTAAEIFIPLCVGGGLRTIDDIRTVLRAGADKVSINTAAMRRPAFIREAAETFGSSTIVVAIEAIKQADGRYECFTDTGREATGIEVLEWATRAAELGAGELLLTSVDREGTGKGFDTDLTSVIARSVDIPVVAHGGAGRSEHVVEVVTRGLADAVCIASLFHYSATDAIEVTAGSEEGNVQFRLSGRRNSLIQETHIEQVKEELAAHGIEVRR